jgi:hypothetical protein
MVAEIQSKFLTLLARCDRSAEKHWLMSPTCSTLLQQSPQGRQARTGRPLLLLTPAPASGAKDSTPAAQRLKRLTAAEMAAKREKVRCYNCTRQFSREHLKTCPMKGIYLLQMDDDPPLNDIAGAEDLLISLNAITSLAATDTMQPTVRLADQMLGTLVDSGSTHSFISVAAASRLHLDPLPLPALHVKVANGVCVATADACRKARIYIDLEEFVIDLFVIPLGVHWLRTLGPILCIYINLEEFIIDLFIIPLGVHWLRRLGPILWDFTDGRMSCWHDNHRVMWQGTMGRHTVPAAHSIAATDLMTLLLDDFQDVFAMSTRLPPPRCFNHRIHLLPKTAPVAVRPYRYPQVVKDELERQCQEMLQQGIIHTSSSAFSSPVLLVKKHDGTWRFCVDYCALNAKAVCDMYPILIVDVSLDEM